MTAFDIVNISMNLCALITTAILLIGVLLGGSLKQPVFRWFFLLILFGLLGLLCEGATGLSFNVSGEVSRFFSRMFGYLSYAFAGLWFFAFAVYLYEYLSLKTKLPRKIIYLMTFYGAAAFVLAIIDQFSGMYGVYDEYNRYHQQDLFWISQVFPTISFLTCMIVTLRYIKVLKAKEWLSLLLYPFAPIASYVIEIIYPELWIAHAGSAFTMLLMYVTLYVEQRQQNIRQEAELSDARVSIMLSQIQPHFLYNALSAIDKLYYENQEEGHRAILTFSKYLRGNLDSLARKEPIHFSDELTHVRHYLWLEELRFGAKLQVVFDIQADDFFLPVLTLQTIVENAVRYGVTKKKSGGTVTIRVLEFEHDHQIEVEDDGVGFDPAAPPADGRSHTGISNVRERLASMCGGELTIHSETGKGTSVIILIPKRGRGHEQKQKNGNQHYSGR